MVIQNYPDLSKEMKSGQEKPLFGKSYVIRNYFWVNFGPKWNKIDPIFVHFGSYWMLIQWWPIEMGQQPLYGVKCLFSKERGR